jgi:DNA polymerase-4
VLDKFTPVVEGASIDEWYLDLTGTEALYHHEPLDTTARRIRAAVVEATGLSISIGGGPNKLVAKLAVEHAKPSKSPSAGGVHIVPHDGVAEFMDRVALAEIPGIGPKLQQRLAAVGLRMAREVLSTDSVTLSRWVGAKTAAWLHSRARGDSMTQVEAREHARQISREETFGQDISTAPQLESELRQLCAKAAGDMRGERLSARTVSVKLRTNDFETYSASRTLPDAVESDRGVTETAVKLLKQLRSKHTKPARLVGVALSNFSAGRLAEQLVMFDTPAVDRGTIVEQARDRDLSRAVDRVREKFGDDAIRTGPPRRVPIGEKGAKKPRGR